MVKRLSSIFIVAAAFLFCSSCGTIGYMYKPLAAEGCSADFSVNKRDGVLYVYVRISSDRHQFVESPTMLLRNFDQDTASFMGTRLDPQSSTYGIVSGSVVIPVTSHFATAEFAIPEEKIPFFKSGIQKIRLTMVPINHEREFGKDEIGQPLYKKLLQENKKSEQF